LRPSIPFYELAQKRVLAGYRQCSGREILHGPWQAPCRPRALGSRSGKRIPPPTPPTCRSIRPPRPRARGGPA